MNNALIYLIINPEWCHNPITPGIVLRLTLNTISILTSSRYPLRVTTSLPISIYIFKIWGMSRCGVTRLLHVNEIIKYNCIPVDIIKNGFFSIQNFVFGRWCLPKAIISLWVRFTRSSTTMALLFGTFNNGNTHRFRFLYWGTTLLHQVDNKIVILHLLIPQYMQNMKWYLIIVIDFEPFMIRIGTTNPIYATFVQKSAEEKTIDN